MITVYGVFYTKRLKSASAKILPKLVLYWTSIYEKSPFMLICKASGRDNNSAKGCHHETIPVAFFFSFH